LLRRFGTNLVLNVGPIAVVLLLWEFSVRLRVIEAIFLPPVSDVLVNFWAALISGDLIEHFAMTVRRMVLGYAIGVSAAIALGITIGMSKLLRQFFSPIVAALYPLPKIALLSLFIVIFGVGDAPIVASVAVTCFFPVLLNTLGGLLSIDQVLIRAASDLGANRFQVAVKVILPGALPQIFTGLRQASAVALIVVVAVEMYIGQNGAGYQLAWATQFFEITLLYTYIVAIGLFGIILFKLLDAAERWLLPWVHH
jgi:NitT/TauT family transport system permease protein